MTLPWGYWIALLAPLCGLVYLWMKYRALSATASFLDGAPPRTPRGPSRGPQSPTPGPRGAHVRAWLPLAGLGRPFRRAVASQPPGPRRDVLMPEARSLLYQRLV